MHMENWRILFWLILCHMIIVGDTQDRCSSPIECEYSYDLTKPVACFCSSKCSAGERRMCYYGALLKPGCATKCAPKSVHEKCGVLCCYQDCQPNPWQEWSSCQGPCGGHTGTKIRKRTVDEAKKAKCGGVPCLEMEQSMSCVTGCCQTNCLWSEWSQWSQCSNTCGSGNTFRIRSKLIEVSCGGRACSGSMQENGTCTKYTNTDCKMSEWNGWSKCVLNNGKCGHGNQTRTRTILQPAVCRGQPCGPEIDYKTCSGPCCRQDCVISEWSSWGFCNVSCGAGFRFRKRQITKPNSCGGNECPKSFIESEPCSKSEKRDCTLSNWSGWSECSNGCGKGIHYSTRSKLTDEACGGSCTGELNKTESCESFRENKDCKVSEWNAWSSCVKNCEGGISFRERTIVNAQKCRGISCPDTRETKTCHTKCEQICHKTPTGIACSCKSGYKISSDQIKCTRIYCLKLPNNVYKPDGLIRTIHYDYVKFKCPVITAAGQNCTVECVKSGWVLRGEVGKYTCQEDGNFNYLKMYCAAPNYPPSDLQLDISVIREEVNDRRCFGNLQTTDKNGFKDSHTYKLMSNLKSRLLIKGDKLCLGYTPNYEEPDNVWNITIRTTDKDGLYLEKNFTIMIRNINDPPKSCKFDRAAQIPENTAHNSLVGFLIFDDEDGDVTKIIPSIVDSDSDNFEIFKDDSQPKYQFGVRVKSVSSQQCKLRGGKHCKLNFEKKKSHRITIQAKDTAEPPSTNYFDLKIDLLDQNDAPTNVTLGITDIKEDTELGTVLDTFGVEDEDNATQKYTYELVRGEIEFFRVDNKSGLVLAKRVDFEDTGIELFTVFVRVTDNGSPAMSVESEIMLRPIDVNEIPEIVMVTDSRLDDGVYVVGVKENHDNDYKLVSVFLKDPDVNETLSYKLLGNNVTDILELRDTGCKPVNMKIRSTSCHVEVFSRIQFNYEEKQEYKFTIQITDKGGLKVNVNFKLDIKDANDAPKDISFSVTNSSVISITENRAGISISTLSISDEDRADTHKLEILGDEHGLFELSDGNMLKLKSEKFLDFEGPSKNNSILIGVTDNGVPSMKFQKYVTVQAVDVNEQPNDISLSNNQIGENSLPGTLIGTIRTSDPDTIDKHQYTLVPSPSSVYFELNGSSILVTRSTKYGSILFNYETKSDYQLNITTRDRGNLTYSKSLVIRILDINEAPRNLVLTNERVIENSPIGTFVGQLMSTDEDRGQAMSYILSKTGNATDDAFTVSEDGKVSVKSVINFESNPIIPLTIIYHDNGSPVALSSTSVIIISIKDVNEAPVLSYPSEDIIKLSTQENKMTTALIELTINDPDVNETMKFECSQSEMDATEDCPIVVNETICHNRDNRSDCKIKLGLNRSLNYEERNLWNLKIQISDKGGQEITRKVRLAVLDVNEPASELTMNGHSLSIIKLPENEEISDDKDLGKLDVVDPDKEQQHQFRIEEDDAILTIKDRRLKVKAGATVNYEQTKSYIYHIVVADNTSSPIKNKFPISINVENINEPPHNLTLSTNQVSENPSLGSVVADIICTDPDNQGKTAIQTLTFSIIYDQLSAFEIRDDKLVIRDPTVLNFEKTKFAMVKIKAIDNGSPALSTEQTFNLTVTDVNDAPTNIRISNSILPNNAAAGTKVGQILVDDEDVGQSHTGTVIGNPEFKINANMELVKVTDVVISGKNLKVEVKIKDNGTSPRVTDDFIQIRVVSKKLTMSGYLESDDTKVSSIKEDAEVGQDIGKLKLEIGSPATITGFQLLWITEEKTVEIRSWTCDKKESSTSCSIALKLASQLDYETKKSFEIRLEIKAEDDMMGLYTQQIDISDVNEAPFDIKSVPELIQVKENENVNQKLGRFLLNDPDANDNDKGSFELMGPNLYFNVSTDGALQSGVEELNYEEMKTTVVKVKGIDQGGLNIVKEFQIQIIDVNEPPNDLKPQSIKVFENLENSTPVTSFQVIDPDASQTHKVSILVNYKNNFEIQSGNKLTILKNATICASSGLQCGLDYESTKSIVIKVRAKDSGYPALYADFSINIELLDSNDSPTKIYLNNTRVFENMTTIGLVGVQDEDVKDTHKCEVNSTEEGSPMFQINNVTNMLQLTRPVDYEQRTVYDVIVQCQDMGGITISQKFQINILDAAEAPNFASFSPTKDEIREVSLKENPISEQKIAVIYSRDPDHGDSIQILSKHRAVICSNIKCEPDKNKRTLCSCSLIVRDVRYFNFEDNESIVIPIQFTDQQENVVELNFTVKILNVDEKPTDILINKNKDTVIKVNENSSNETIGYLTALDDDENESYSFEIMSDESESLIVTNGNLLKTKTSAKINYETKKEFSLTISAKKAGEDLISKQYSVQLLNLNEKPSELNLDVNTVREDLSGSSVVATLSVTDPDNVGSVKQKHSIVLENFNSVFYIDQNILKLNTDVRLDYESVASYNLSFLVTDNGTPPKLAGFWRTLIVTDVNDAPISLTLTGSSIPENAPIGTQIGKLSAIDPDQKTGRDITYVLEPSETRFIIKDDVLSSGSIFNYEETKRTVVTLIAMDNGSPSLNITRQFQIDITDVNERPTMVIEDLMDHATNVLSVKENMPVGTVIGHLSVTDQDEDETFEITIDNINLRLVKSDNVGIIQKYSILLNASYDFENIKTDNFNITIKDRSLNSIYTNLQLVVVDINEIVQSVSLEGHSDFQLTIRENLVGPQLVGAFNVQDQDENDLHKWTILNSSYPEYLNHLDFRDQSSKLYLKPGAYFDYEALQTKTNRSQVSILVGVKDKAGNSYEQEVIIVIEDTNDVPVIGGLNISTMPRFVHGNTILATLNVTDEDRNPKYRHIACLLLTLTDVFHIKQKNSTFQLTTKHQHFFNRSNPATDKLNLTVQCSNSDAPEAVVKTIELLYSENTNDEPMQLVYSPLTDNVVENMRDVVLGKLSLTTKYSETALSLRRNISIETSPSLDVQLNKTSGSVNLVRPADHETTPQFIMKIRIDGKEEHETKVTVTDVNEPPTDIQFYEAPVHLNEKSPSATVIGHLFAPDPDDTKNHTFTVDTAVVHYRNSTNITNVTRSLFQITANNTLVYEGHKYGALIYNDVERIDVRLTCIDYGLPINNISRIMRIPIFNINDAPSGIIVTQLREGAVREDVPVGTVIGSLKVVDDDKNDTHTCSIDNSYITINQTQIIVEKRLDYETSPTILTKLTCRDGANASFSQEYSVTIADVNEAPTDVRLSNSQIVECTMLNEVFTNITAEDPEGSKVQYTLLGCKESNCPFSLDQDGDMRLNTSLMSSNKTKFLSFDVRVSDVTGNFTDARLQLKIIRLDEPVLRIETGETRDNFTVLENSTQGIELFQFNLTAEYPQIEKYPLCKHKKVPNLGVNSTMKRLANCSVTGLNVNTTMSENIGNSAYYKVYLAQDLDYESTNGSVKMKILCYFKNVNVTKELSLKIGDINEAPSGINLNQTTEFDLATIHNNDTIFEYTVSDSDTDQKHNIFIGSPCDKYLKIDTENKQMTATNVQYSRLGTLNCSMVVFDNGVPTLTTNFTFSLNVTNSAGYARLSKYKFPISTLKGANVANVSYISATKVNGDYSFDLRSADKAWFNVLGSRLVLTKDAEEFTKKKINIMVSVLDEKRKLVTRTNIRLEIENNCSKKCPENARCIVHDENGQEECQCKKGYKMAMGAQIECTKLNYCISNPCLGGNESRCISEETGYRCECGRRRNGKNCEVVLSGDGGADINCSIPCINGVCVDNSCVCSKGWTGQSCEISLNECENAEIGCNMERGAKECMDMHLGFICLCRNGYRGYLCELSKNCTVTQVPIGHNSCVEKRILWKFRVSLNVNNANNANFSDSDKVQLYGTSFYRFLRGIAEFKGESVHSDLERNSTKSNIFDVQLGVFGKNMEILDKTRVIRTVQKECLKKDKFTPEYEVCSKVMLQSSSSNSIKISTRSWLLKFITVLIVMWKLVI